MTPSSHPLGAPRFPRHEFGMDGVNELLVSYVMTTIADCLTERLHAILPNFRHLRQNSFQMLNA